MTKMEQLDIFSDKFFEVKYELMGYICVLNGGLFKYSGLLTPFLTSF